MRFGRRAGKEATQEYTADRELAASYPQLRAGAAQAERDLRDAQARGRPLAEIRRHGDALDHALGAALEAALAGERAAMGPRAYGDRIARRRASVRDEVRPWTSEVASLRTFREEFRMEALSRTGTLIPEHVRVGSHTMSSVPVAGAEPGQPDDAGQALEVPRVGVDLDGTVGQRPEHG